MVTTKRLRLIPSTPELARAEIADHQAFALLLGASVPHNWPPESVADVLHVFLGWMEQNPSWGGWLGWYAVTMPDGGASMLIGGGGFKGPPGVDGVAEVGYAVLPQYQRLGYATEMVGGLVDWARGRGARGVVAQTTDDNAGSRGVLRNLGFVVEGPGDEVDHSVYRLSFDAVGGDQEMRRS